jgi:hypothetical protein
MSRILPFFALTWLGKQDRIAHRALSVWHPITHPLSDWNAAAQADKDRGRKRRKK